MAHVYEPETYRVGGYRKSETVYPASPTFEV
jgi:hypothetical protein